MSKTQLSEAVKAPINDRKSAETFMTELQRLGLDYHFDDGAVECLFRNGVLTRKDALFIEDQVKKVYDAWKASGADMHNDCPLGFMLKLVNQD